MLNHQPKTADIATLISEKVDCKVNTTLLEIMIKESIHQEENNYISVCI